MVKGSVHLHSYYSSGDILKYDCIYSPEIMVKKGSESGLKFLCPTEHNTLKGIERWIKAGKKYEITIVPGIEFNFKTGKKFWFWEEQYHVIILGIEKEPPKKVRKDVRETCLWAKDEYDAFIIAPHNYSLAGMKERAREEFVDAIEVHNPHANPLANLRAKLLCKETKKIPIAGADAHSPAELEKVELEVNSSNKADDIFQNLKEGKFKIIKAEYNHFFQPYRILSEKYGNNENRKIICNYLKRRSHFERAFGLELLNSGLKNKLRAKAFYTLAHLAWQTYDSLYHSFGLIENLFHLV